MYVNPRTTHTQTPKHMHTPCRRCAKKQSLKDTHSVPLIFYLCSIFFHFLFLWLLCTFFSFTVAAHCSYISHATQSLFILASFSFFYHSFSRSSTSFSFSSHFFLFPFFIMFLCVTRDPDAGSFLALFLYVCVCRHPSRWRIIQLARNPEKKMPFLLVVSFFPSS